MPHNLRRALKNKFDVKQDRIQAKPGILGNGAGVLEVSGLDHYVYVRTSSAGIEEVFNNRVPPENDLLVMVGYDPAQPDLYQVLSTRSSYPGGTTGGTVAGYAPALRYSWMAEGGGQDPVWIDIRQFLPLRIGAYLNMLVQIYRGVVKSGVTWVDVLTQTKNLTAYLPSTAGNAAYVLITVNTSGAVIATKGMETTIEMLTNTDIPAAPAGTLVELAAIRVYAGQTAIQEARSNTDIKDLRTPYYMAGLLGARHTIQNEGIDLPARSHLNFLGSSVSATDDEANDATVVTIGSSITQLHEHVCQEDHSGECNGSKVDFVIANEYQAQTINVWLNGLLQLPTVAFTEGTFCDVITLTTAPVAGDELITEYITA